MRTLLQRHVSLKPYNTFGIAANTQYFMELFSEHDLKEVLFLGTQEFPDLLVLGGGSNVLFTKDFAGLVLKISIPGISVSSDSSGFFVTAGGGVVWNDLVQHCVREGLGGLENLSLIPGTVGASPIQNIGAYGVELKDVFHSCEAYEISTGRQRVFDFSDCQFGYRDSIFKSELKGQYIIGSVTFRLSKTPRLNLSYGAITEELARRNISSPGIADVASVVASIRVSKLPDPSTIGNAGSFFKNPIVSREDFLRIQAVYPEIAHFSVSTHKVKLAAGWLIEKCGFKGVVCGETGTWKNQALVLVNYGSATGQEVYSFSEKIISKVNTKFNITLEREVNVL